MSADDPTSSPPAPVPEYGLRLSAALREVLDHKPQDGLTLGHIIDSTEERAFGVLMAFLCLPFLIPLLPGISVPFGLAIVFLGLQLAIGWHRPWLPRRMRNWHLPDKLTGKLLSGIARLFNPLEKIIRPRMKFMQNRGAYVLVGAALMIDGALLALPLPIPGSNVPPAWMALILILGITEEDGVTMIVGLIVTAIVVVVFAWLLVVSVDAGASKLHHRKQAPATTSAPATMTAPAATTSQAL